MARPPKRRDRPTRATGPGRARPWHAALIAVVLLGLLAGLPAPVGAVEPVGGLTTDWETRETEHFRFFVQANDRLSADAVVEQYQADAERAYEELSLLFATAVDQRIAVYVYDDLQAFDAAVLASGRREIDGIDVVAHPRELDISIALPRFAARSELEAENQIRHATAHILLGVASGFNIPRGFDEGIARYVERLPLPSLSRIVAAIQTADQRGSTLSWSNLNRPQPFPEDEAQIEAQSYAVAAFLIEDQEIPRLQQLLTALKTNPGWRDAIKVAYAPADAGQLERQWKESLPRWLAGEWKNNLLAGFDLEPAKELLANGNYKSALDLLERSERLFQSLDAPERRDEVTALKDLCAIGIQAEEAMSETQQALERHNYDGAAADLEKVHKHYASLPPEHRPDELIAQYQALTAAGLAATDKLNEATALSHSWLDAFAARKAAETAGASFARLGDEENRNRAVAIVSDLDTRQRRLVLMLGALAVLTLAWLALWLWARGPSELQWE